MSTTTACTSFVSYEEAKEAVGGYVEIVHLFDFHGQPAALLVNEEGTLLGLPSNPTASVFARGVIRGNVLLLIGKVATRGWTWEDTEGEDLPSLKKGRCPFCNTPVGV